MNHINYFLNLIFSSPILFRCTVLTAAVISDLIIGDPYGFPHPVKFMGKIISIEENAVRKTANSKPLLKASGFVITAVNITFAFAVPYMLLEAVKNIKPFYLAGHIILCYTCIASRSLHKEAEKVRKALDISLSKGRKQVSNIVGRDVDTLSEEKVIKACVESVSENTTDGVIAPLFFMALLGTGGAFAYKMINTMDSMLGYKNEKYLELGFAPAKTDDAVNFIPARLSAILMLISAILFFKPARIKKGFIIWRRDKKKHAGPNPAQTESVAAGLLGIKLGGPHFYAGELVVKPEIGNEERPAEKADIARIIKVMYGAEFLFVIIFILVTFILKISGITSLL